MDTVGACDQSVCDAVESPERVTGVLLVEAGALGDVSPGANARLAL